MVGTLVRLPLPPGVVPPLAATLMLAFLLRETRLIKFPLPQNARLVPQFVTRVPVWGSLQFGIELGTGMRTYSPTGLPHVTVVALFFLGGWQEAVATGTGFAAGRAVMMLTFILARDKQLADHAFQSLLPHLHWALLVGFVPLALALSHLDAASQIRYAVGALLGAAVVGKLRDLRAFWRSLGTLGLSGRLGWVAAAAVLAVEVLAVAVIFLRRQRRWWAPWSAGWARCLPGCRPTSWSAATPSRAGASVSPTVRQRQRWVWPGH